MQDFEFAKHPSDTGVPSDKGGAVAGVHTIEGIETESDVVQKGTGSIGGANQAVGKPPPFSQDGLPGGGKNTIPVPKDGDRTVPGVMIRESPSKQSLGTMQTGGGGGAGKVNIQDLAIIHHEGDSGEVGKSGIAGPTVPLSTVWAAVLIPA
ncbi:MAG: hypothetical protein NTY60_01130 [Proteobacteria bacterium]|nr:hypothetical protein [Pseudomonadota bacterium]